MLLFCYLLFTDLDKNKLFLSSGVFNLMPHRSSIQLWQHIHQPGIQQQAGIWRSQWGATMKTDCTTNGERYLLINTPDRNTATTCHSPQASTLCFGVLDMCLMPTFHLLQFCNSPHRTRAVREKSNTTCVFLTALSYFKISSFTMFHISHLCLNPFKHHREKRESF